MKILILSEVIDLKSLLAEKGQCVIHLHDACGSQYFSAENMDEEAKGIIQSYLEDKGLSALFNADNSGFRIIDQT